MISTRNFSAIVSNAVAAVQGAASALVDFGVGSISLALIQAFSGLTLWLQAIALQVAALTRFSTSTGADADSWAADYGFTRLSAVASTGVVTFSRYTATQSTTIPIGTVVQTSDGTQQFQVVADTTQTYWSPIQNAYVIPSGQTTGSAAVQALTAGSAGNVITGVITVLAQSIIGVDAVDNDNPTTGGADSESDSEFKARFVLYLQSLTEGTKLACINAVLNLQEGATCSITENQTYAGVAQAGYFYAVVDDGTGTPSTPFLTAAYAAIDKVRAIGTSFGVFAPVVVTVSISATITVAAGYTGSTVRTQVQTALTAYINMLTEGQGLPWSKLFQVMYDASGGVSDVTLLLLNSGTTDITVTSKQILKIGTVTLS